MFKDKKLRNTFQIAAFTLIMPGTFLLIGNKLELKFLVAAALVLGVLGLFISISILRRFFENWKTWNPKSIKIVGIIMAVLGIVQGIYAIFLLMYVLSFQGPAMIG